MAGMNLYMYAANNPVIYVDPYGWIIEVVGDRTSYEAAKGYLGKSGRAAETIRYLENSKEKYTVVTNSAHEDGRTNNL